VQRRGLIDAQVSWDLNGNFTTRQDLKQGLTESFVYDPLNRLDDSTRNGTTNLDVTLDAIGNVTWKSGVGSYSYHATKRRAVIAAGANSYGYDANGNLTSRNGNSISYTSYNLPGVISAGTNSSTLSYGAWRNRSKQVAISGGSTEITISVAGLLEKVTRGSVTEYRHRIAATPGVVALYTRRSAGSPLSDTYYVHRDHLGSPELITRANGTAVVGLSFSAYGERRDTDWDGPIGSTDLATLGNTTREGYTGHAMLDGVGLVHMNGRVYDPVIGRFLSRDPLVDGRVSQGANGYAYVWSNPLTLTDPSGYVAVNVTNRYLGFTSNYLSGGQWIDHPVWAEGSSSPDSLVVASRQSTWVSDPMRSLDFQRSLVDHALGTESAGTADGERGGSGGGEGTEHEVAPQEEQQQSRCVNSGGKTGTYDQSKAFSDELANAIVGFGDAFFVPILVRGLFDIGGTVDFGSTAYAGGMIAGTLTGAATIALRGGSAIGGTRLGHGVNHNPYVRIGPGRMPAAGRGLPSGTHVPRASFGGQGGLHVDLRSRLPHLPPVGALVGDDNGCN